MTNPDLPPDLVAYRETAVFSETTVPQGLLRDHRTATGVWGLLTVLEGTLEYTRMGSAPETISQERPAVIRPEELHKVECSSPVLFKIVFLREPDKSAL